MTRIVGPQQPFAFVDPFTVAAVLDIRVGQKPLVPTNKSRVSVLTTAVREFPKNKLYIYVSSLLRARTQTHTSLFVTRFLLWSSARWACPKQQQASATTVFTTRKKKEKKKKRGLLSSWGGPTLNTIIIGFPRACM